MGKWAYDSAGGVATWVPWQIDADKLGGRSVSTSAPSTNDVLTWNGTAWAPAAGGSGGAPVGASYVTLGTDGTLTSERVLTAGTGISLTDAGAGSTVTIASTVTQGAPVGAQYVTLATDGTLTSERVLTAGTGITLTDAGAGSTLTVATSVDPAPKSATYVTLSTDATLTNERTLAATAPITLTDGGAGSTVTIAASTFGAGSSGIVPASGGGTANYLRADGTWASPASGAPVGASYVVISLDGTLTSERTLAVTAPVTLTDGGAGGNATIAVSTFGSGASGVVPASGGGTSNFLRADGTWAAPSGGADPWTYVKLGSDFVTSSATAVNVTGLLFTPAASQIYEVRGVFMLRTATATVGPRPGCSWPTGLTDGVVSFQLTSAAGTNVYQNGNINAAVLAPVGGLPNTTQSWPALMFGMIHCGGSPSGNFQVQLASETAGTNVTMKAQSWIAYRTI